MELGVRLKAARLEAGLSQRQLCGDTITRNMLSQIENGTARPSMDTLTVLAARLGKPLSWFLGEGESQSTKEQRLVQQLEILEAAEQAILDERLRYASELMDTLEIREDDYCAADLNRRRLLLLARANPQRLGEICQSLPSLDEELQIRSRDALQRGDLSRAGALLDSAENQDTAQWNLLRGQVYLAETSWENAAVFLLKAEGELPQLTIPLLEQCYRELGDFKQAYFYACKQK